MVLKAEMDLICARFYAIINSLSCSRRPDGGDAQVKTCSIARLVG